MKKPIVEVISPANRCECSFSVWINKVWDILSDYQDNIKIVSLTSDSQRAQELGIANRSVIINGEVIPIFMVDQKLKQLLSLFEKDE